MNIFIFAIDGASPDLVNQWIDEGHLSNLEKIKKSGLSGKLESTFPPLTGPAWSSFQTGVNPGKHGVFNWLDTTKFYGGKVIDSNSIKTRTVWNLISSNGGKVGLLSLPVTYPPEKVNGFIVPGFLTPENSQHRSYPKDLAQKLERSIPEFSYYVNAFLGGPEEDWIDYLKRAAKFRGAASRYLIKEQLFSGKAVNNNKLFLTHFLATDSVQHFLWDKASKDWDPRLEVFDRVDQEIGKIMELAPDDSTFIIVSDHGFGPIDRTFNVNNWLKREGYLKFKRSHKTLLKQTLSNLGVNQHRLEPLGEKIYPLVKKFGLINRNVINAVNHPLLKALFLSHRDVDWPKTVAYSKSDIGHVRLNISGREERGSIRGEKLYHIREEIKEKLKEVKLPGTDKKMAEWVEPKEEFYFGPYFKEAPDLLFSSLKHNTLCNGAVMFPSNELFDEPFRPGNHRREGLIIACGPGVAFGEVNAKIMDIAPTLLNLFNLPIPKQMDGEVIKEIASGKPKYYSAEDFYKDQQREKTRDSVSRERLKDLGYL